MNNTRRDKTRRVLIIIVCILSITIVVIGSRTFNTNFTNPEEPSDSSPISNIPTTTTPDVLTSQSFGPIESIEPIESEQPSPSPIQTPKLDPFSSSGILSCAENVYYGVYYFDDNTYYANSPSKKTPSASVIKVFIMQYVYDKALEDVDLNAMVKGKTIQNLVKDMIQKSDNTATNILIDKFGMEEINNYIRNSGYKDTVLSRRMLDFEARNRGLDNYTSLDDVMAFLTTMYTQRHTPPYRDMLEVMKGQTIRTKLPLYLPATTVLANKTGELNDVENDIGIVFSDKSDFAIAVLTNHTKDSAKTRTEIGHFAKKAYEFSQMTIND